MTRRRVSVPALLGWGALLVLLAAMVVGVGRLAGARITAWATAAAFAVALVAWQAVGALRTEPSPVRTTTPEPDGGEVFRALRSVQSRVDFSLEAEDGYERSLRTYLRRIGEDRLRQRDGIDVAADESSARARLGPTAWGLLYGHVPHPPTLEDLEDLVERLE